MFHEDNMKGNSRKEEKRIKGPLQMCLASRDLNVCCSTQNVFIKCVVRANNCFLALDGSLQIGKGLTFTFVLPKILLNEFCILAILDICANVKGQSWEVTLLCNTHQFTQKRDILRLSDSVGMVWNLSQIWKCSVIALLSDIEAISGAHQLKAHKLYILWFSSISLHL